MINWFSSSSEQQITEQTMAIANEFYHLLKLCIPWEMDHDVALDEPFDQRLYTDQIRALTNKILGMDPNETLKFGGSMPFSMSRRNLEVVLRNDYYVTEKTDGVRYLLFVVKGEKRESEAVLFDRSCKVRILRGSPLVAKALGMNTVLDGELVYDSVEKKTVFLVFDVLAIDGESVCGKPFRTRLNHLEGEVGRRCKFAASEAQRAAMDAINLIMKNFLPKKDLRVLLGRIKVEGMSKTYRERDKENRVRQQVWMNERMSEFVCVYVCV